MMNFFKSRNIYKLIVFIFILCIIVEIRGQLVTLKTYNSEIALLNEKIATLEEQTNIDSENSNNSKEDNENMARKDLKMYYPNETPYKGY